MSQSTNTYVSDVTLNSQVSQVTELIMEICKLANSWLNCVWVNMYRSSWTYSWEVTQHVVGPDIKLVLWRKREKERMDEYIIWVTNVLFLELVFPEVCVPHPSLNPIPGPSQTLHKRMAYILLWIRGTNAHKKEGVIGKRVLKFLNDLNGDGNFHFCGSWWYTVQNNTFLN